MAISPLAVKPKSESRTIAIQLLTPDPVVDYTNGRIGIETTPTTTLDVTGDVNITGSPIGYW